MMPDNPVPTLLPTGLVTVLEPAVLELVKLLGLPSREEDEVMQYLASFPPIERIKEALILYEPIPEPIDDD